MVTYKWGNSYGLTGEVKIEEILSDKMDDSGFRKWKVGFYERLEVH